MERLHTSPLFFLLNFDLYIIYVESNPIHIYRKDENQWEDVKEVNIILIQVNITRSINTMSIGIPLKEKKEDLYVKWFLSTNTVVIETE